ncbi:LysR family transcriptional regulator [Azotobacter beijerinckii]|uniref:LysR family transcriptional regulator n=1 Tax=Azotobacter beijerinckii TaxID=170623 RepID=UPI002952F998|nr:LysR family transcriptional regulator [Azotobacter beijerinckii]MDV7213242.1 LysR family transcriptional regulator [Azotobacter beijerinckii]
MDYRDLSYFETIAELGHLGRASEKLCRTQSALSKCIRRLEEELGTELFERNGRRILLTPIGALLLERAKILRRGMDESKRQLMDFSKGIKGHVRLGASTTMAELLLPTATSRFLTKAPDVTIEVKIGMNDTLRDSLQAGHIDLMLGPIEDNDSVFVSHPIVDDDVVIVAGPDHPVFQAPLELGVLTQYRWVLASTQVATRRWLDAKLQKSGHPPTTVQVETNSIILLPQLIARNQLLSLLSRRNLGPGRPGYPLREVPIPNTTMKRTFGVIYRDEAYLTPAALCLLHILKNSAEGLIADRITPNLPHDSSNDAFELEYQTEEIDE